MKVVMKSKKMMVKTNIQFSENKEFEDPWYSVVRIFKSPYSVGSFFDGKYLDGRLNRNRYFLNKEEMNLHED